MYQYPSYQQGMLPPQQILQANGRSSIDALRMAPNSSALIADQTAPIIWKCISDSLGNVSATAYDIVLHKDEKELEKENLNNVLNSVNDRLERLEKAYESFTSKLTESANGSIKADAKFNARSKESASVYAADSKY